MPTPLNDPRDAAQVTGVPAALLHRFKPDSALTGAGAGDLDNPTVESIKQMAAELLKTLPRLSYEQAENGLKCLSIAYLSFAPANELEKIQAVSTWEFTARKVVQHQTNLYLKHR